MKQLLESLPEKPGIYQFISQNQKIIYVGKAKNIKRRVLSYFSSAYCRENPRIASMVKKIANIEYLIVNSESDALLLENNLIKKHKPPYNVQLKDDKSFPYICIKNERFPRVFPTRNIVKDGSEYFGPYTSMRLVKSLLDLFTQLFGLRTCNYNLSEENIKKNKFHICLEYHIKNCKAPCHALQSEDDYNQGIKEMKEILKGNIQVVINRLRDLMNKYSSELDFENAQVIKEKIETLEKFQSKSTVVNTSIHNVDVFSIITDENYGYVNYLKILNGSIVQIHTVELQKKLQESDEELLCFAITNLRERFRSESTEIIVPFKIEINLPKVKTDRREDEKKVLSDDHSEDTGEPVKITVPTRGDKKKLLDLSFQSVKWMIKARQEREKLKISAATERILSQIKQDLNIKEIPVHIECFDNSNLQGTEPVSALVVFKNAKPAKNEYRHFNIKTVRGVDDFASFEEVIERRYKRLLEENKPLPQLVIIDGGKGQLGSALKGLKKLSLDDKISIIAIAKKLEEIYRPGDPLPLHLDKRSDTLKIIQHIRNEAHRFAISHHRKRITKKLFSSELNNIPGINEKTIVFLFRKFKTLKKIRQASLSELEEVIGKSRAKLILEALK